MKKAVFPIGAFIAIAVAVYIAVFSNSGPATNPDPNHTHADFAVWANGERLDFTNEQFMSEAYVEGQPVRVDPMRKYLHLHDGNGHTIHRHKPGLTFGEFMRSLGVVDTKNGLNLCLTFPQLSEPACGDEALHRTWMMKVNNDPPRSLDFEYVFNDVDKILIMLPLSGEDPQQQLELAAAWEEMTNDACLYSQTCPERGKPPVENCIADPEVPCVIPEE